MSLATPARASEHHPRRVPLASERTVMISVDLAHHSELTPRSCGLPTGRLGLQSACLRRGGPCLGALRSVTRSDAGSVTAGSVTAGSVTAGSVTAGSVTAGSVTAGSVTAGSVTAGAPARTGARRL